MAAMRRKGTSAIPKVLRLEAVGIALELIWAHPDATIVKILMREYSVSDATARKIIRDARALVAEEYRHLTHNILAHGALELQAVFRAAFRDKRYAAAVSAKRAQLELLTGGQFEKPCSFGHGKSEEELLFYAEHGFWPEERVITASGEEVESTEKRQQPGDPLAMLPPVTKGDDGTVGS